MSSTMKIARRQRVVPWYAATRLLLLLLALNVLHYFNRGAIIGDVQLYHQWITGSFDHGEYPLDDQKWQYPPGAAGPLLLPHWLPGSYFVMFFLMCLAADVLVFVLLLRAARAADPDQPSPAGPWLWTLGVAAIGPMAYGRYDLVVTATAVAALTVTLRSKRATAITRGALIGVGAFLKLWPAALLFGAPKRRNGRLLVGVAAAAAVVPTLLLQLFSPGVLSFLTNQKSRGIQVESVFASPFLVGKWFGWSGTARPTEFGAFEYFGTGVTAAGKAALVATAAGFAALLLIRRRAAVRGGFPFPAMLADVGLAAVLVAVVTSRVLSPQYLVWLLGVAAVCLTRRATLMRTPAWLVLGAVSVTQLIFPLFYHSLRGGQVYSGLILLGRNAVLVTAAILALRALWRATGPASGLLLEQGLDTRGLGENVSAPFDREILRRGAEDRPEGLIHRISRPLRRAADGVVESD
ncbi:glycosyltransferase family 87 protein [Catenulispora subtropica]|uniref:glycosyltransferase family 87 protein n=1 Tax=Catenulispora subtropica TaxID=450798 RepID=UPI0031E3BFC0